MKYFGEPQIQIGSFVARGIQMNKKDVKAGMKYSRVMSRSYIILNCMEYAESSHALPVLGEGYPAVAGCASSGNHGITATLPVAAVGENANKAG